MSIHGLMTNTSCLMTHRRTATDSQTEPELFQHAEGLDDALVSLLVLHTPTDLVLDRAVRGRADVIRGRRCRWMCDSERRWGIAVTGEKNLSIFAMCIRSFSRKGCSTIKVRKLGSKKHSNFEEIPSLFSRQWEAGGGEAGESSDWWEGEEWPGSVWG